MQPQVTNFSVILSRYDVVIQNRKKYLRRLSIVLHCYFLPSCSVFENVPRNCQRCTRVFGCLLFFIHRAKNGECRYEKRKSIEWSQSPNYACSHIKHRSFLFLSRYIGTSKCSAIEITRTVQGSPYNMYRMTSTTIDLMHSYTKFGSPSSQNLERQTTLKCRGQTCRYLN